MNILILALIFVVGYLFIQSFAAKISEENLKTLKKLFLFHILFGIYFCFFVQGDAIGYWKQAKLMSYTDFIYSLTQDQGTYFIFALNYYPSNVLDLSYFTGTMLYSLIGFIGLVYFYVMAVELIPNDPKYKEYYLFPLLFFLPNLHFWSCGVGKDTLLFFCIAIFIYGLIQPIKRMPMIVLGLALSYFIRPHITLFMLLGFGIAYFSGRNISLVQRVLFFGVMIAIAIAIVPKVLEFAKIEEASLDSFDKFSQEKGALLSRSHTGSSVDISSYPFPLKVFTFLYRPFFFDINGIPALLASFENLLLLILSFSVLKNKPLQTFKSAPFVIQGMVYFLIIGTLAFSQTLGNLGIIIRMRNMFLPGLIIYIFWHFSYRQSLESEA
ncbi:hypothetical protein FNW25_14050 [Flavobacterium franklandianum]|uniref:hypothetical protein n=1 Tax=Flavobacterium franklandianum TaxID=2594430 RepID=UPI00117A2A9A|nr:hypothetical protein [Flavobacterium franklandianum]TRX23170.1 hypothetical protein FNW25_14050 [Flavobacterium franklandianum]